MLSADVLDGNQLSLPDLAVEERQPVSRCRGERFGAVLWLEPRADGGYEQFIEAVDGMPGAWTELLFSCSSDWSYSSELYRDELYLSGFTVTATIGEDVVHFITGVAPSERGKLRNSQGDEVLVLSSEDNPGGSFIAAVKSPLLPVLQWHP